MRTPRGPQELEAVEAGHPDIADDHVEAALFEDRLGPEAVVRRDDFVAGRTKDPVVRAEELGLVVHHEDSTLEPGRGRLAWAEGARGAGRRRCLIQLH